MGYTHRVCGWESWSWGRASYSPPPHAEHTSSCRTQANAVSCSVRADLQRPLQPQTLRFGDAGVVLSPWPFSGTGLAPPLQETTTRAVFQQGRCASDTTSLGPCGLCWATGPRESRSRVGRWRTGHM